MKIRRNASLTALAAACALFLGLITIGRMLELVALPIAVVVGGAVLVVLSHSRPEQPVVSVPPDEITLDPPLPPPSPLPPPPYQAQQVAGIPLPSMREDYGFVFSATVYWRPAVAGDADLGQVAISEIVRRAREITEQRDPAQAALVRHELATLLTDALPDSADRMEARAESVQLLLNPDDQRRLEEIGRLRKEKELWDYQRQHERSKRQYLREEVLKDPGSAVVWWLARNEGQPEKVAADIEVLAQLAHAAGNTADHAVDDATGDHDSTSMVAGPQTPAKQFGAFVDSLNLRDDDARLMLTKQMASLMESYGYSTVAKEITGPYDEWPGDDAHTPDDGPEPSDW